MQTSTIVAEEIMTRQLAVTTPETHIVDGIERLIALRVSGLPVIDSKGHFTGRFTERSAITALNLEVAQDNSDQESSLQSLRADSLMEPPGMVLPGRAEVFQAVELLVQQKSSGAPVVDADGRLLGVFTENSAMRMFIGLCWEQLPSSCVTAWMDDDAARLVSEDTTFSEILDRFQYSKFRRLMVVRDGKLVGRINRRDVLRAAIQVGTERPLNSTVEQWMNSDVPTIGPAVDVLTIAQMFIHTSMRQLPVVEQRQLRGQVSRCDLLRAIQKFFPKPSTSGSGVQPLYLSAVNKRDVKTFA